MIFAAALALLGCLATGRMTAPSCPSTAPQRPPASQIGPFKNTGDPVEAEHYAYPVYSGDSRAFIARKYSEMRGWDTVRVWDIRTLKPSSQPLPQSGPDYGLTFDAKVAFTTDQKDIRFWDVATSKLRWAAKVTEGELEHAAISADGAQFLTIAEGEHAAEVWRTGETRPRLELMHERLPIFAQFDPTGRFIATDDGWTFHLFSVETGREICPPIHYSSAVYNDLTRSFDLAGDRILIEQQRGFTVVATATGKTLLDVTLGDPASGIVTHNARWSADSKMIVVTAENDEFGPPHEPARIYDAATGKLERTIGVGSNILECWVTPGARWALCLPEQPPVLQPLEVWDLQSGQRVQTLDSNDVYVSPDASVVLTLGPRGLATVWRLRQDQPSSTRTVGR